MIRMLAAAAICITLLTLFMLGVFTGQAVLIMSSVCLWTPGCIFLGFSLKPIRLKIDESPVQQMERIDIQDGMRRSRLPALKKPPA